MDLLLQGISEPFDSEAYHFPEKSGSRTKAAQAMD
jgi:hypothetical protein